MVGQAKMDRVPTIRMIGGIYSQDKKTELWRYALDDGMQYIIYKNHWEYRACIPRCHKEGGKLLL